MSEEEEKQDRKIELGLREDGSPYIQTWGPVTPLEALGLSRWFQMTVEDSMSTVYGLHDGRLQKLMTSLVDHVKGLTSLVELGNTKILEAMQMNIKGFIKLAEGMFKGERKG